MYEKYKHKHFAVISSPIVAVFVYTFHSRYLYSLLFHVCYCIYIYSDWLKEEFCNLSSKVLYILSLQ